jgi:CheY-like chemotaxis protein
VKANDRTRELPIIVVTTVEDEQKGLALGADLYANKPVERKWLLDSLTELVAPSNPPPSVLLIEDEEAARYLLRRHLSEVHCAVHEAPDGPTGLRLARELRPDVIFLDLVMPTLSGFETLDHLKSDPETRDIPVIIMTSKLLMPDERARLSASTTAILTKESGSRAAAVEAIRDALLNAGLGHTRR